MPKFGRKIEPTALDQMWHQKTVTGNAPYGTDHTPTLRVKILASKDAPLTEEANLQHKWNASDYHTSPVKGSYYNHHSPNASPRRGRRHVRPTWDAVKLLPLTEKPHEINPGQLSDRVQAETSRLQGYTSAQKDSHNTQIHSPDYTKPPFSPHKILPPIHDQPDVLINNNYHQQPSYSPTPSQTQPAPRSPYGYPQKSQRTTHKPELEHASPQYPPQAQYSPRAEPYHEQVDLSKLLPHDSYLPMQPIVLNQREELELQNQARAEMKLYDREKLKAVYMALVAFDTSLTGFLSYKDISSVFIKQQVHLSAQLLRLVSSKFVRFDPVCQGVQVNYEKVLSYLSAALGAPLQQQQSGDIGSLPPEPMVSSPRNAFFYNPITHEAEDMSPRGKYQYGAGDNAKLLRLIEDQVMASGQQMDFERIWEVFRAGDRNQRGTISREQIKTLSRYAGVPLQESVMDQIISKCDCSGFQYRWEQYLEFIERVQPLRTGLPIPDSRQPKDYVKHYPQPTNNWPNNSDLPDTTQAVINSRQMNSVSPRQAPPPAVVHPKGRPEPPPPVNIRHQQMGRLNDEINDLERDYEEARQQLIQEGIERREEREPWRQRFTALGTALYSTDTDKSGYLALDETRWIVDRFNQMYNLNIKDTDIEESIVKSTESGKVSINSLLTSLSNYGP